MKKTLKLSIVVGSCLALFVLIRFLSITATHSTAAALRDFGFTVLYAVLTALAVIPFAAIVLAVLLAMDKPAISTKLHLIGNRLSARLHSKNSEQIFPCLQAFFYDLLCRNNTVLHLPLGKDAGCLIPKKISTSYRSGCVFYHLDLIAAEAPEMDMVSLRNLLQAYINKELFNFGIAGLGAVYVSAAEGRVFSVYLDRVFYHEPQQSISFDLLYVCTEEAARYVRNAAHRDAAPVQKEAEVYDNDL